MKKILTDKRYISLVAVAVILVAIAMLVAAKFLPLKYEPADGIIADGVKVSGVDVGGLDKKAAEKLLADRASFVNDAVVSFEHSGKSFELTAVELALKADVDGAIGKAYAIGRSNDAKKNKTDLKKAKKEGINLTLHYNYDEDKLLLAANDYFADKITDPTPMMVEIGQDCLVVTNSVAGVVVNIDKAKASIDEELQDFAADKAVSLVIEEYKPANLTFEQFVREYQRKAGDAKYTKVGDTHNIEPEVVGISFDKAEAKKIFLANRNATEPYEIPAEITYPEVTAKELEDKYINHIIASYTTSFAGSSWGRCTNVALSASKIDGYVLNPGERFSYNKVVGPRTEAAGFKMAHVYVGGEVVDGIGGGICQTSSTLYNAVVLADLKTVTRTSHSLPVSYVPMGRDATVAYGTIDYVFENNKSYPVSIRAKVSGTNLTISVVGISDMDYTVDFVSVFNSTIPYSTVTVEDPALPAGEQKVLTPGANGSMYDSYRVYKRNGVEYDRKHESKSRYQPTTQKIAVGVAPPAALENEQQQVSGDSVMSPPDIAQPTNPTNPQEVAAPDAGVLDETSSYDGLTPEDEEETPVEAPEEPLQLQQ